MKKKEVIKHSAAIQISNDMNLMQRRAWNVLLAYAYNRLAQEDKFALPLKELCAVLKYNGNNDKHLKKLLRDLIDIKVEWNILNKDGDNEWGAAALLAEARIINGVIFYGYAPTLRERLHNPSVYAKISLSLQNRFNSKHSLALYELFIDYFNMKMNYGETPWISVENFRKLIGLKDYEYKEFKTLNLHVIKKSIKEINEKTNIQVRVEYQRNGRKVVALKYYIKENPKNPIDFNVIEDTSRYDQSKLPLEEFEIENQQLFNTLTTEFGISNNKAVEILKTKDEFYIDEVLDCVRQQIEAGNVKNSPAYTVKALEEDYRRQKSKDEIDKEQKQQQKKQAQEAKKIIENLKTEFDHQSKTQIEKFLNDLELDESRKAQLVKDFEKDKIENSNNFIKRNYQKKGLESHGNQLLFRAYLAKRFLPEDVTNFEAFAKKQGHEVVQRENGEYELNIRKTVKP